MALPFTSYSDFYSAILLIIMFVIILARKDYYTFEEKTFIALIITSFLNLVTEGISYIVDGHSGTFYSTINYITNLYLYVSLPITGVIWAVFIDSKIHQSMKHVKKVFYYLPFLILMELLVIVNFFTHSLFFIDSLNVYQRGPLYFVSAVLFYTLFIYLFFQVLFMRKNLEKHILYGFLVLLLLPAIGGSLQLINISFTSMYTMLALGLVTVYMSIETVNASKDPMTKLNTRKKILEYMESNLQSHNPFTAILIDMDNLKKINDQYGHHEGDQAIIALTEGLLSICENHHMASRIGGDEFLIITSVINQELIEERLYHLKEELNKDRRVPVLYSFGMCTIESETTLTVDDILMIVDEKMYEQKALNKGFPVTDSKYIQ